MKLTEIAKSMKQKAIDKPGAKVQERLPRGGAPDKQVRIHLKSVPAADGSSEFHLQIQRVGSAPKAGTIQVEKWRRELSTFARDFGAPSVGEWTQQVGETTYAAVLCWDATPLLDPAPARATEEPEIDPVHTEIIGVLPKPIRIPSTKNRLT